MKIFKAVVVPETTRKVLVHRECDLCHVIYKGDDWGAGLFKVNETEVSVTVKRKEGTSYPEGGSGVGFEIDLCPNCFKDRLVPWLASQGANIVEFEWEW